MPEGFEPPFELELALHPDDANRLPRLLGRGRGGRAANVLINWHDTPEGELAAAGLALLELRQGRATRWRLERLCPEAAMTWPSGMPAPVLAEAADRDGLGGELPDDPLLVLARFHGRLRTLPPSRDPAAPTVSLLQGSLRATQAEQPVCRVMLAGEPGAVASLALELAQVLRVSAPPASLSAEARGVTGRQIPTGPLAAPKLPPDLSAGAAFAFVCAHLGRVILHYAPLAEARQGTEPVHQLRVAVRRLRSAFSLFRRAAACPEFEAAKAGLRGLGRTLGPARDWDVFVTGTGEAVAAAFPADPAVTRLVAAAGRRRDACYDELRAMLAGAEFRRLGIVLASLAGSRPWEQAGANGDADAGDGSLHDYAARALTRRLRHLTEPGGDIADLPEEDLHAIRLRAKRLRYGSEIFSPLFPRREVKRFIRRLTRLQEALGHLNDGRVAADLIAELGPAGGRGFAAGAVRGFIAAGAIGARTGIDRRWRRFRRLQPFWE